MVGIYPRKLFLSQYIYVPELFAGAQLKNMVETEVKTMLSEINCIARVAAARGEADKESHYEAAAGHGCPATELEYHLI